MYKDPTKKEIDDYFKRVEDPANYSSERWWHLFDSWKDHILTIMIEKKWVDDGSDYYAQLINTLRQVYEAPLHDFVAYWVRIPQVNSSDRDIEQIVKTWKPCNKEIAMLMYEKHMDNIEIIWKMREDKIIKNFHQNFDECMGISITKLDVASDCIFDIKHHDNWKKLEIIFKKSNMNQMKYRYEGEESDWIDISKDIMKKGRQNPVPLAHVQPLWDFCNKQYYELDDDKYDIPSRANQLLKKWFLPNAEPGSNPICHIGKYTKQGIETTKYESYIQFSYHP